MSEKNLAGCERGLDVPVAEDLPPDEADSQADRAVNQLIPKCVVKAADFLGVTSNDLDRIVGGDTSGFDQAIADLEREQDGS